MRFRVIADNVSPRGNFSDQFRALSNVASNQEERCWRLITIEQVQQLRRDRRIGPVIKRDGQLAGRIRPANRGTKKLCTRMDATIGHDARRRSADRRRSNEPGIHGRYCRT